MTTKVSPKTKKSHSPKRVNWAIRIPEDLLDKVKDMSRMHERSINAEIIYLLKKSLEIKTTK